MDMISRATDDDKLYADIFADSEKMGEELFSFVIGDEFGTLFGAEHAMDEICRVGVRHGAVPDGTPSFDLVRPSAYALG